MLARPAGCRAVVAMAWLYKRRGRPGWWVNGRWREGCTAQALDVLLLLASRRGFAVLPVHETFDMARTCGEGPTFLLFKSSHKQVLVIDRMKQVLLGSAPSVFAGYGILVLRASFPLCSVHCACISCKNRGC